jgi:UDP-N-acetyl-D-galactosamine dehydrogenase
MGMYVANRVIKIMIQKGHAIKGAKVLVLGVTFKENCPDIRNSKVIDIYTELKQFGLIVDVYDPNVNSADVKKEYGIIMVDKLDRYDAIILAVSHNEFLKLNIDELKKNNEAVVYDIKSFLDKKIVDARL